MQPKILARKITSLTDARYFSAKNITYLSFDLNPDSEEFISLKQVNEITEWIEGPKLLLEMDGLEKDAINELKNMSTIDQMIFNEDQSESVKSELDFELYNLYDEKNIKFNIPKELPEEKFIIISFTDTIRNSYSLMTMIERNRSSLFQRPNIYWDLPISVTEMNYFISHFHPFGMVVRGSSEEKLGMKSFEELDELFDEEE